MEDQEEGVSQGRLLGLGYEALVEPCGHYSSGDDGGKG